MHELALIDLTAELPRIAAPMTVVYATPPPGGGINPAQVVHDYTQAYRPARTAELIPIANSGHMIMYDHPQRFRAAVTAFLQESGTVWPPYRPAAMAVAIPCWGAELFRKQFLS